MAVSSPTQHNVSSATTYALPAYLTIETAEAVAMELQAIPLSDVQTMTLDAGQVELMTSPGLQIIAALAKTMENLRAVLRIDNASDAARQPLINAGLQHLLHSEPSPVEA